MIRRASCSPTWLLFGLCTLERALVAPGVAVTPGIPHCFRRCNCRGSSDLLMVVGGHL